MTEPDPTPGRGRVGTPLSVTVERQGGVTVVTVSGEVDLESSGELTAALAGVERSSDVDVDLAGVTYLDSTGLRALLTARDTLAQVGGKLRVSATSNIVARLIEITGTDDLLQR